MSHNPVQIIARGSRAAAEAAAEDIDSDVLLEGATYSILEEDEDRDIWRIDAFPTSEEEVEALTARLAEHPGVTVKVEPVPGVLVTVTSPPEDRRGRRLRHRSPRNDRRLPGRL